MNIRRIIKGSVLTALLPFFSFAAEVVPTRIPTTTNFDVERLFTLAGKVIEYILRGVGVVVVVMLIWAGYLFITGTEDNIKRAKEILKYAIIGIIVVILSFSIVAFLSSIIGV